MGCSCGEGPARLPTASMITAQRLEDVELLTVVAHSTLLMVCCQSCLHFLAISHMHPMLL